MSITLRLELEYLPPEDPSKHADDWDPTHDYAGVTAHIVIPPELKTPLTITAP